MLPRERPMALGDWPGNPRPDPQPCRCGGWLVPLSEELWYCGTCGRIEPPDEPKRDPLPIQLSLPLEGHGRLWYPGPRRYVDRFGNEVLRREA